MAEHKTAPKGAADDEELFGDFVREHGSMDIEAHEKTFESFVKIAAYFGTGVLIFLFLLGLING